MQRWGGEGSARLFYIHGLQSRGDWLLETGPELSARGVCVEVLNRPGSGLPHTCAPNCTSDLLDLYQHWLTNAHVTGRRTVVGQSLGASARAHPRGE